MNNTAASLLTPARRVDPLVLIALTGIFLGWFVLDTLVIQIGPVHHTLKFYEMLAAVIDPSRVLMGLDSGHLISSIVFGLACAMILLACHVRSRPPRHLRPLWVFSPLLLMVMIAFLLYLRLPGDLFKDPGRSAPILSDLVRLTNDLFNRGAAVITRASAGPGLWVSSVACVVLIWNGHREKQS